MTTNPFMTARPSTGAQDLVRMYDLADTARGDAIHVTDLLWRLNSPSAQVPNRTQF